MIRHFLPVANLLHSLYIWWASSFVGASITARTPEPKSSDDLDNGAFNCAIIDTKYDNVFPVPVGEIAAKSLPYRKNSGG